MKNYSALPLIGELINRLKDTSYFTKLNFRRVYNFVQIALEKEWKTAF